MLFKNKDCKKCGASYDETFEYCPNCDTRDISFDDRQFNKRLAWLSPLQQIFLFLVGFAYCGLLFYEFVFSNLFSSIAKVDPNKYYFLAIGASYLLLFISLVAIVIPNIKSFSRKYNRLLDYVYGLGYAIALVTISSIVGLIMNLIIETGDNVNQGNAVMLIKSYPLPALLVLGIIGPICEELTYRVGLFSFLSRFNKYIAYVVAVLIFAFIHFDVEAEDMITELASLPSYIVAGLLLTIAYDHRGPACSMTAHILYNCFAFLLQILAK